MLSSQAFLDLPAQALIKILGRNSFCAPELEIFGAVKRWIDAHMEEVNPFIHSFVILH